MGNCMRNPKKNKYTINGNIVGNNKKEIKDNGKLSENKPLSDNNINDDIYKKIIVNNAEIIQDSSYPVKQPNQNASIPNNYSKKIEISSSPIKNSNKSKNDSQTEINNNPEIYSPMIINEKTINNEKQTINQTFKLNKLPVVLSLNEQEEQDNNKIYYPNKKNEKDYEVFEKQKINQTFHINNLPILTSQIEQEESNNNNKMSQHNNNKDPLSSLFSNDKYLLKSEIVQNQNIFSDKSSQFITKDQRPNTKDMSDIIENENELVREESNVLSKIDFHKKSDIKIENSPDFDSIFMNKPNLVAKSEIISTEKYNFLKDKNFNSEIKLNNFHKYQLEKNQPPNKKFEEYKSATILNTIEKPEIYENKSLNSSRFKENNQSLHSIKQENNNNNIHNNNNNYIFKSERENNILENPNKYNANFKSEFSHKDKTYNFSKKRESPLENKKITNQENKKEKEITEENNESIERFSVHKFSEKNQDINEKNESEMDVEDSFSCPDEFNNDISQERSQINYVNEALEYKIQNTDKKINSNNHESHFKKIEENNNLNSKSLEQSEAFPFELIQENRLNLPDKKIIEKNEISKSLIQSEAFQLDLIHENKYNNLDKNIYNDFKKNSSFKKPNKSPSNKTESLNEEEINLDSKIIGKSHFQSEIFKENKPNIIQKNFETKFKKENEAQKQEKLSNSNNNIWLHETNEVSNNKNGSFYNVESNGVFIFND